MPQIFIFSFQFRDASGECLLGILHLFLRVPGGAVVLLMVNI
jgi:hypothetical protein